MHSEKVTLVDGTKVRFELAAQLARGLATKEIETVGERTMFKCEVGITKKNNYIVRRVDYTQAGDAGGKVETYTMLKSIDAVKASLDLTRAEDKIVLDHINEYLSYEQV